MVKAGQSQLGQVGQIAVPGAGGGLQLGLGVAVLTQLLVGDAGKIVGLGALGQPAEIVGHGHKLAVGLFGAVGGGGVNAGLRRSAGLGQGRV